MRRAFDGSDIVYKAFISTIHCFYFTILDLKNIDFFVEKQIGQREQGFPPRPQSAKVFMHNNLIPNTQGNEYLDDPINYLRNKVKVREGSGNPSHRNLYPPRHQSGGMQGEKLLKDDILEQFFCFDDPERDSRLHKEVSKTAYFKLINHQVNSNQSSNVNNSFSEVSKHMPRIISQDKEQLYADTLTLKAKVNELTEENLKIKTKLSQSERESGKLKKMVEQYEGNAVVKGYFPRNEGNSHITESLKKNVKDLRSELQEKDNEIQSMKKQLKFTRVQELEIERKSFMEECQRLKKLLQQACNEKMEVLIKETDYQKLEERIHFAIQEAEEVKSANRELVMQIEAMQNINSSLSQKFNETHKKLLDQISKQKITQRIKEREIVDLKNIIARLRGQPVMKGASYGLRPSSAKVEGKLFGEDLIQQKDQQIKALQQEVSRLQSEDNQVENFNGIQSGDDIESLNNRDLTLTNDKLKMELAGSKRYEVTNKNQEQFLESHGKGEIITDILVTRVRREDVLRIGEELQYKLRALSLSENEIAYKLFENLEASSSIRVLHALFQKAPFSLEPSKSLLLVRYLIEERTDEYPFSWDEERTNQAIFESFNDIVGTYKVFSTAYAKKIYDSLLEVFTKNRVGITASLELREKRDGTMTKEDFIESLEILGILLQKDQIAFLIMAMILKSAGLDKLNYKEILQLFQVEQTNEISEDDEDQAYKEQNYYDNQYGYDKLALEQQIAGNYENNHKGINEEDGEYYDDEEDENIEEDNQDIYDDKAGISPEEYDILLRKREQELLNSWKDETDEESLDHKGIQMNTNKPQYQQQSQRQQLQQQQSQKYNENQQKQNKQNFQSSLGNEEIVEVIDNGNQRPEQKVEENNYEEEFDIVSDDEP